MEILNEVIININLLWGDFYIGKFLDIIFYIVRIYVVVNKIYRDGGK